MEIGSAMSEEEVVKEFDMVIRSLKFGTFITPYTAGLPIIESPPTGCWTMTYLDAALGTLHVILELHAWIPFQ